MIRTRFLALATAAGVFLSAAALAQQAYTTRTANVRAGPDRDFPVVVRLAPGSRVYIAGCLAGYEWCDVDFGAGRGWVNTRALQTYYGSRVVPLYDYGSTIGLPLISFSLFNYWDRYYRDRPWYHDRPRWEQRWGRYDGPRYDGPRYTGPRYDGPRYDNRHDGRWDNNNRPDYRPPRVTEPGRPYVDNRPRVEARPQFAPPQNRVEAAQRESARNPSAPRVQSHTAVEDRRDTGPGSQGQ